MTIRSINPTETKELLRLCGLLWPDHSSTDLEDEVKNMLTNSRETVFVADDGKKIVGFIEVSLRDVAENCSTSPVGFIEGWYVESDFRKQGIGKKLVEAAEQWAREQGCTEMASDADHDNDLSHRAHTALGYEQLPAIVPFRKNL